MIGGKSVPNTLSECLGGFDGADFGPLRLVNTDLIKDRRELMTVLCLIDILRIRTKNGHTALLQPQRNILRQLSLKKCTPISPSIHSVSETKEKDIPPTLTTTPCAASSSYISITLSHPNSSKYSLSASSKSVLTVSGL